MSNITIGGQPVEFITFSDGSETCRLPELPVQPECVSIHIENCTRDVVRLALVKDAILRNWDNNPVLFLEYLPQARADRVFEYNMPLPLKVFCDMINAMRWQNVYIQDPHSPVAEQMLNNRVVQQARECLPGILTSPALDKSSLVLCAPDKGATERTKQIADKLKVDFIQGYKTRDVTTGQITGCGVECNDLTGKRVLMVDDISDGGATFYFLAKEIRKLNPDYVGLHVTHGIFSKGLQQLSEVLDWVSCYNIVCNYVTQEDFDTFNVNSKFFK